MWKVLEACTKGEETGERRRSSRLSWRRSSSRNSTKGPEEEKAEEEEEVQAENEAQEENLREERVPPEMVASAGETQRILQRLSQRLSQRSEGNPRAQRLSQRLSLQSQTRNEPEEEGMNEEVGQAEDEQAEETDRASRKSSRVDSDVLEEIIRTLNDDVETEEPEDAGESASLDVIAEESKEDIDEESQDTQEEKKDDSDSSVLETNQVPTLAELPALCKFMQSGTEEQVEKAVTRVRKLLSISGNHPPITEVIDAGATEILVQLVVNHKENGNRKILFEALWALTNIASGTSEQTLFVADSGLIPYLVEIVSKQSDMELVDQSIWCLGNFVGDCVDLRDRCVEEGVLDLLAEKVQSWTSAMNVMRNLAWTMSNFARGSPAIPLAKANLVFDILDVLLPLGDVEVEMDCLWSLVLMTREASKEHVELIVERGFLEKSIPLSPRTHNPKLQFFGAVLSREVHLDVEILIENGILQTAIAGLRSAVNTRSASMSIIKFSLSQAAALGLSHCILRTDVFTDLAGVVVYGARDEIMNREIGELLSPVINSASSDQLMSNGVDLQVVLCYVCARLFETSDHVTSVSVNVALQELETLQSLSAKIPAFELLAGQVHVGEVLQTVEQEFSGSDQVLQVLDELRQSLKDKGVEFSEFSEEEIQSASEFFAEQLDPGDQAYDAVTFVSFKEAVQFWVRVARLRNANVEDYTFPFDKAYTKSVLTFLHKLSGSKEFENALTRVGLANRLLEVFKVAMEQPDLREAVVLRMIDSIDRCNDKPMWALNQLHVVLLIGQARGDRSALRALSRRLMRLNVVHESARKKLFEENLACDDVSLCLYLEIKLRVPLDLPVSSVDMWFPGLGGLTDEFVQAIKSEVESIGEDQYEAFLMDWDEWKRQDRVEAAESLKYDELKRSSMSFRKSLTNLFGSAVEDPVRFRSEKGECSFQDLIRHWINTGMDLNNVPRSIQDIQALKRGR